MPLLQSLVALLHLLEPLLGVFCAPVLIGMHLSGKLPVGVVQLALGCICCEPEEVIVELLPDTLQLGHAVVIEAGTFQQPLSYLMNQAAELMARQFQQGLGGILSRLVCQAGYGFLVEGLPRAVLISDNRTTAASRRVHLPNDGRPSHAVERYRLLLQAVTSLCLACSCRCGCPICTACTPSGTGLGAGRGDGAVPIRAVHQGLLDGGH
mmetsp:Transcript_46445/g.101026  ORF Transcript_46445/g.101026 Transcript_46445/m.101026 type:complete len:209 (+) Transcript_46445:308-934(+)